MQKKKHPEWGFYTVFIAPSLLIIIGLFCFKSSLPFRVEEIKPVRDFLFQATQTASQEELERLRSIFSKPFVYEGEGDQYYLFASQNNEYLLKFFKMRKLTPKYWLNYIPFPWLEQERLNKIGHRERARQEVFGNFKSAFEEFRHQTSLCFIHFFNTNWLKSRVQIFDQENSPHWVNLDGVPFVLQRKTVKLFDYVEDLILKNKNKEAISSLVLLLDLVKDRCLRGFADQDGDLERDYGFVGNRAVFIDVEGLEKDESLKNPLSVLREVFKISQKINDWLSLHHPHLLLEFQKDAQDLLGMLEEIKIDTGVLE